MRKEINISPAKLELYEDRVDRFRAFLEIFILVSIVGFIVFEIYFIPMRRNKSFWRGGNVDKILWFLVSSEAFELSRFILTVVSSACAALRCGAQLSECSTQWSSTSTRSWPTLRIPTAFSCRSSCSPPTECWALLVSSLTLISNFPSSCTWRFFLTIDRFTVHAFLGRQRHALVHQLVACVACYQQSKLLGLSVWSVH